MARQIRTQAEPGPVPSQGFPANPVLRFGPPAGAMVSNFCVIIQGKRRIVLDVNGEAGR